MKNFLLIGTAACVISAAAIGVAQTPPDSVHASRHMNLAAAQQLIEQAFQKISDAQKANHSDLGEHALKAKQLLTEANHELGMAADVSNQNEKHH